MKAIHLFVGQRGLVLQFPLEFMPQSFAIRYLNAWVYDPKKAFYANA
jgi:hypothetical protein